MSRAQPVRSVSPGPYVMLTVRDSGTGLDADVQAHLFEPFFTTKEQQGGTGLGLAVVWEIVQGGGGTLRVESEPGHGTTFYICFPQAAAAVGHGVAGVERQVEQDPLDLTGLQAHRPDVGLQGEG